MFQRMVIGECLSEEQAAEFVRLYRDGVMPALQSESGFVASQLLTEEGGNMVICETTWADRDACLRYHSSRSYRQFVGKTQHLLAGNFVVKLFKVETAASKDEHTLAHIRAQVDGVEWTADTPNDIAAILRAAGWEVREPQETS